MGRYKVDIAGIKTSDLKVISNEEMKSLFIKMQAGDALAKETIINGNLRLVLSLVQRFDKGKYNVDDLFQIGCVGLIKAVDNFDLMGPKFARRSMSQVKYRLLNINNNMLMEETFNSLSAILDKFGHVITRIVSANNLTLNETEKTDVIAGWLTD